MLKTYKIIITGQVQGVGFRPFVYVLANQFDLKGTVSNNENGVIIYLTGIEQDILSFYKNLIENPPQVSIITSHSLQLIDFEKFDTFQIIPSKKNSKLNLQLTPDFAICDLCKNEISDPANRRYNYPFTTCVNCGPRWAITNTFPFERSNTSMHKFEMCETCKIEYTNPEDRRFHSQTNSCSECGIQLTLTDKKGAPLKISNSDIFKKISTLLQQGNIIAIKNTGGYLLCCNASDSSIVQKLRKKKKRPNKPFAILYPSLKLVKDQLIINKEQEEELISSERPIVIIPKTNFKGNLALEDLAPNLNQLGIMLPYSGILQLLANKLKTPLVATSGNLHGSPIISKNKESLQVLQNVADYFLHHNIEISNPQDDSVVKFSAKFDQKVLFRRSRGYAPNYFGKKLRNENKIMAMGGHLKSTIAFLPNDYLYISQYLGNLDHYDVYDRFTKTVTKFKNLFEQQPDVILTDKHPSYQSTQYGIEIAKTWKAQEYKIQHHKAHFAAVLGEHNLFNTDEPVLGIIWDGTGYGEDGQIWGGEFFNYQDHKIERVSHFEYFDWLAGDKMAKEPRLSLFSLGDSEIHATFSNKYSENEFMIYQSLKKKNKLKTSSVGRLFDAVASLLGLCDFNTYEGEAAILLENMITSFNLDNCKLYCTVNDDKISTKLLFKNLYHDFKNGAPKENIIINFIYTLASIIFQVAEIQKIKKIAFSGGVFQNTTLVDMINELGQNKYKLYFNRKLAPNDENISYGQIMYYLNCR